MKPAAGRMDGSSREFRRAIVNTDAGVALDLEHESQVILIVFSGLMGRLGGVPLFEFFNVASTFGVKKVFLRDLTQSWYHRGVVGIGPDIPSVSEYLARVIDEGGATRTVLAGNSGGAYAALLFGQLLNADEVHAFGPQTFIDPELLAEHDDRRYTEYVDRLLDTGGMDQRYVDLVPVLSRGGVKTTFHVYYNAPDQLQTLHCRRLAQLDRVVSHAVDAGHQSTAKGLRDTGELTRILERALAPRSL